MADENQVEIIHKGSDVWNSWREDNPKVAIDLDGAILNRANLKGVNLSGASLIRTEFRETILVGADLSHSNLTGADFYCSLLLKANLSESNLSSANLYAAYLRYANLDGADLSGANLESTVLVETSIERTIFRNLKIYGIAAWDLNGNPTDQSNLIITREGQSKITVDDLQVAQFIYLMLNNVNIRKAIDTITSKVVLILGRFNDERKIVLDAIREELKNQNFTPILFDFQRPASKDLTGTIETLARLARFIIADLTDPNSIPHELATIIPFLRTTPIQPIRLEGAPGYTMFDDFRSYKWVLDTYNYKNSESLIAALSEIIKPADVLAETFRNR